MNRVVLIVAPEIVANVSELIVDMSGVAIVAAIPFQCSAGRMYVDLSGAVPFDDIKRPIVDARDKRVRQSARTGATWPKPKGSY